MLFLPLLAGRIGPAGTSTAGTWFGFDNTVLEHCLQPRLHLESLREHQAAQLCCLCRQFWSASPLTEAVMC